MTRILMVALALVLVRCSDASTAPATAQVTGAQAAVAKIVFVDKEKCCECTQKRVDAGWSVLSEALDGRTIPVERLHADTQKDAVEPWRQKKPFMALPAAYLVGPGGELVAMLQGEWTKEQVTAALGDPLK